MVNYPIIKQYHGDGIRIAIESKTNRVLYEYRAHGIPFTFDLLSHVGEPFIPAFQALIAEHDLQIETYDNGNDKHAHGYYERLKH
jgi:hypothetical protein